MVMWGIVYCVVVDQDFCLNQIEFSIKGILIFVDEEVVVYGVNRELWLDDGYLVLFMDVLGKEYYIVFYLFFYYYCEFVVIGVYNYICVYIKLFNYLNIIVNFRGYVYYENQWINVIIN